ncbi:MAG: 3-deoxy-D-manno-octulosonic acid transferase, partial [Polaromonas sp.]|nr:3-deoxy-D-manno-octulosonic acid transferase [Polaromonas sp.]
VYPQTADDAKRFRQLGVDVAGVFGNLKFDATPSPGQQMQGKAWRHALQRPVLMFASSREGEEGDFFKCFSAPAQQLRAQAAINTVATDNSGYNPEASALPARILLVPRHPQRFHEVEALAVQHGLTVSRRSSWPAAGPAGDARAMAADVWLGDSLGEMAMYYAMSDVALLGGSFAPLGGQNLIEAAACGCPVVMGPHTFNFAEAASQAEASGAAHRVASMQEAVQLALQMAADPQHHTLAVQASLAFAGSNRGATARTLDALQAFLWPAV